MSSRLFFETFIPVPNYTKSLQYCCFHFFLCHGRQFAYNETPFLYFELGQCATECKWPNTTRGLKFK